SSRSRKSAAAGASSGPRSSGTRRRSSSTAARSARRRFAKRSCIESRFPRPQNARRGAIETGSDDRSRATSPRRPIAPSTRRSGSAPAATATAAAAATTTAASASAAEASTTEASAPTTTRTARATSQAIDQAADAVFLATGAHHSGVLEALRVPRKPVVDLVLRAAQDRAHVRLELCLDRRGELAHLLEVSPTAPSTPAALLAFALLAPTCARALLAKRAHALLELRVVRGHEVVIVLLLRIVHVENAAERVDLEVVTVIRAFAERLEFPA